MLQRNRVDGNSDHLLALPLVDPHVVLAGCVRAGMSKCGLNVMFWDATLGHHPEVVKPNETVPFVD
jgi:hypothetical protein